MPRCRSIGIAILGLMALGAAGCDGGVPPSGAGQHACRSSGETAHETGRDEGADEGAAVSQAWCAAEPLRPGPGPVSVFRFRDVDVTESIPAPSLSFISGHPREPLPWTARRASDSP